MPGIDLEKEEEAPPPFDYDSGINLAKDDPPAFEAYPASSGGINLDKHDAYPVYEETPPPFEESPPPFEASPPSYAAQPATSQQRGPNQSGVAPGVR